MDECVVGSCSNKQACVCLELQEGLDEIWRVRSFSEKAIRISIPEYQLLLSH